MQIVRRFPAVMSVTFCALMITMAFLGTSSSTSAQAHPTECSEFATQAEAQTYFDNMGEDYLNFDADGNGIACDQPGDYGQTGPSAHPDDCSAFATQAEAQTYFDNQGEDYLNLDSDGNGIACDEADVAPSETSATASEVQNLPVAGSGLTLPASSTSVAILLGMCITVGAAAFQSMRNIRR